MLLTAAIIAGIAVCRVDRQFATAPSWYWRMKVEWRNAAAIVLAGDSQVYRGLVPAVFEERLGQNTLNFGFSSAGFDDRYLDAIERVVDAHAPSPIIVLGVSAWSLTPAAATHNGFIDAVTEARSSRVPAAWLRSIETVERRLLPLALNLRRNAPGQRATADDYEQEFYLDGWVASDRKKRTPAAGIEVTRRNHRNGNIVSANIESNLARRIATWKSRGWQVLAFVPPTTPEAASVTKEVAQWNSDQTGTVLQEAGATWIEINDADYESYDGSHLTADSARRLSRRLADELRGRLP